MGRKPPPEPRCGGPLRPNEKHSFVGGYYCEKCGWNNEMAVAQGQEARRRNAKAKRARDPIPPCIDPRGHRWSQRAAVFHCLTCGYAPEAGVSFKVKRPQEILPDPLGRTCFYCGVDLTLPFGDNRQSRTCRTRDHINPRALGGGLTVSACKHCNSQKGHFTISQWYTWRCLVGLPWPPEPLEPRGVHRRDIRRLARARAFRKMVDARTLWGPDSLVGFRTRTSRK